MKPGFFALSHHQLTSFEFPSNFHFFALIRLEKYPLPFLSPSWACVRCWLLRAYPSSAIATLCLLAGLGFTNQHTIGACPSQSSSPCPLLTPSSTASCTPVSPFSLFHTARASICSLSPLSSLRPLRPSQHSAAAYTRILEVPLPRITHSSR